MQEFEKEFYANLGLLSVKFAKMEHNFSIILVGLIGNDDDLITVTLIEKNNLNQNVELLKKINKIRQYEEKAIINQIELIGRIRRVRNLFIHGVWGSPFKSDNDIKIICDEKRIKHNYKLDSRGYKIGQTWNYNENHIFRLSYIKKQITIIDDLISSQEYLINKLETEDF